MHDLKGQSTNNKHKQMLIIKLPKGLLAKQKTLCWLSGNLK